VIDVGEDLSSTPALFETNGATGEWVALSHCWGGQRPLETTIETLADRTKGIPMDDFPPTFRDAVEITQRVKLRYNWIDTLCIIQDDHIDWQRESTKMNEIYSNAALCIAASGAPNATAGIFASADRERYISRPLLSLSSSSSIHNGARGNILVRLQMDNFPYTLHRNEELHRRAWTLQERVLSPRILDFASSRIHWECRSATFAENTPDLDLDQRGSLVSGRPLFQYLPQREKYHNHPNLPDLPVTWFGLPDNNLLSWWYNTLLPDYFTRNITVHSDLLPAIAGVAQNIAERTGYHYQAGLWEEDFHRGLLWQSCQIMKKDEKPPIPSWSWASVRLPWSRRRLDLSTYQAGNRAKVVTLNVTTTSGNLYAQIQSSCLILEGYCRLLSEWKQDIVPVYNNDNWMDDMQMSHRWVYDDEGTLEETVRRAPPGRVICTLDERPAVVDTCHEESCRSDTILMQIARFGHQGRGRLPLQFRVNKIAAATVFALILQPIGKNLDEYRRIGIAEIPVDDGMADGWERMTVSIV